MSEGPKALIVGAGPTALVMAHELARDGIQCRLIGRGPLGACGQLPAQPNRRGARRWNERPRSG
jgi:2-polyprenyl-6-methoxyphenol hydroxylase-like FAD-dependent oxidoreductase